MQRFIDGLDGALQSQRVTTFLGRRVGVVSDMLLQGLQFITGNRRFTAATMNLRFAVEKYR